MCSLFSKLTFSNLAHRTEAVTNCKMCCNTESDVSQPVNQFRTICISSNLSGLGGGSSLGSSNIFNKDFCVCALDALCRHGSLLMRLSSEEALPRMSSARAVFRWGSLPSRPSSDEFVFWWGHLLGRLFRFSKKIGTVFWMGCMDGSIMITLSWSRQS